MTDQKPVLLEARGLFKSYGKLPVLKGIDLTIGEAEIVSIVGASGAGKSTLLHLLGTLDSPDAGEVYLQGQRISGLSNKEVARFRNQNIGFIFQFHNLLPEFTALENVCLPGFLANRPEKEVEQRAKELLEMLGLGHRLDHKPSEMSGGEQQRTAVARALINSPKLIFADEPSGNLDSKNADELHHIFFKLREDLGQTFVLVTHNPVLADMADRKLTMKDGFLLQPEEASEETI
ncbi:ATP-binding cassette domain-containing protein [Nibribacter ruber]|uniref:ATP-binding cassette domain-containing protein n=1 Tax=Nibribacter ruber TaxID=2698458 RepID=A0A6P1NUX2_9BACT|nr:ABC transporter ATP-binding protein [Nibribacter ruber]QHL86850.1 ATP-binding cassette domain-containing protein [Nibribacter ruber]